MRNTNRFPCRLYQVKKMNKYITIIFALFIFNACSPKVISNSIESKLPSRIHLGHEPFAIIETDTINRAINKIIGSIVIKDSGLSLKCDYTTVKNLAKDEALKLGGNCIVITEHKKPSQWSTCHRIKADVLLIDNAKDYETEIIWNKNRKLEISDFKGPIEKRPFTAATLSSFRYQVEGRPAFPNRYSLSVEAFFDCYISYFKHTEQDSSVLAHEQIHFDISELYARKFIKRIEEEAKNLNEFMAKQESILNEVGRALQLKQDEYDSEVYADRSKQIKWNKWIDEELKKYAKYADKKLLVKPEK